MQKIHWFYTISGLIHVKLEKTGPFKVIIHMVHLNNLFPGLNIENW